MNVVQRQLGYLIAAIGQLTRLPTRPPRPLPFDARAARFYPAVGHLVGLVCAIVWLGAREVWDGPVSAALAIATGVLLTGGMHERALAHSADALGGDGLAAGPDRRRAIGAFGATVLTIGLALRGASLSALDAPAGAAALVIAHGLARALLVAMMAASSGAADQAEGAASPLARVGRGEAAFALVWGLAPLALRPWPPALFGGVLAAGAVVTWTLFVRRGGRGGATEGRADHAGAGEQIGEAALLTGCAAHL